MNLAVVTEITQPQTMVRYLLVSIFNITAHQSILFCTNSLWDWSGGLANAFAAMVVCGPAFLLTRSWVWKVEGTHDLRGQVLPFWVITVAGLIVSTICASVAQRLFGAGLAVNTASFAGYGIVWVVKFFLLGRIFGQN
jgi:putative flippase GtrA